MASFTNGALIKWGHSCMGHWLKQVIHKWALVEWSDLLMHNSLKFSCLLFTSVSCAHQTKKEAAGRACVWRRSWSAAAAGRLHEAATAQLTHLCGLTIKTKLIATHQK